ETKNKTTNNTQSKGGKNRRRGKNENESEKRELVFKEDGQEYAQVIKMLGNGRLEAMCFDGTKRLCHIRGKLRKKVWINTSDIILVGLRDYQDNKADVILKYNADEARSLKAYGELPEHAKINETDTFGPGDDDEIQFDDIGDDDEDIDDVSLFINIILYQFLGVVLGISDSRALKRVHVNPAGCGCSVFFCRNI
uniref:Eukaryotic translation initiation factor 4C n=1 Tax=Amphiprion ocellaris TaxID=80972 RepID=A0AAQ5WWZ6_AMPOC